MRTSIVAQRRSFAVLGLMATYAPLSLASALSAQQGQNLRGAFTTAQANAGADVYAAACATCHMPGMTGQGEASPLVGPTFRNVWGARPVTALLETVQVRMPVNDPGSLSPAEAAAVTAYILRANGVVAGTAELTASSEGTVVPGSEPAPEVAGVPPVPGRPGTTYTPDARQAPPEYRGEVSETATGITETFRAVASYSAVTSADLASPPPGDWLHWRGSPGSNGYSSLDQINNENVSRLQLEWVWSLPNGSRYRTATLERDGVLFITTAGGHVQALDAVKYVNRPGNALYVFRVRD